LALFIAYGFYDEIYGRQRLSRVVGARTTGRDERRREETVIIEDIQRRTANQNINNDGILATANASPSDSVRRFTENERITQQKSSTEPLLDKNSNQQVTVTVTANDEATVTAKPNNNSTEENAISEYAREKSLKPLPTWRFLLFAICDVEANYLVVLAYRYTSPASVALLDSFTIPASLVLSSILLNARYRKMHFAAIFMCLCGLILTLVSDWLRNNEKTLSSSSGGFFESYIWGGNGSDVSSIEKKNNNVDNAVGDNKTHENAESDENKATNSFLNSVFDNNAKNPVLGDFIVLAGAALYAASNVQQETLLKNSRARLSEVLATLGLFGSIISFIQSWSLGEWTAFDKFFNEENVEKQKSHLAVIPYFIAFQLCMFILYSTVSVFLTHCDAVLFNLSLLTSDIYVVVWQYLMRIEGVTKLYIVSFLVTMSGLVVYYFQPAPVFVAGRKQRRKEAIRRRLSDTY